MKIKLRLALQFSFFVIAILSFILVTIYFYRSYSSREDYYLRLEERLDGIIKDYFENDGLNAESIKAFQDKYFLYLLEKNVEVYNAKAEKIYQYTEPKKRIDNFFINQVINNGQVTFEDGSVQYLGQKFRFENGEVGVIFISAIDRVGLKKLEDLKAISIWAMIIGTLLSFIFGALYSSRAVQPFQEIISQVNQIGISQLSKRLVVNSNNDEISQLANTFNNMLERLEDSFKMQKNFINHASHEFRTPLTAIIGSLEVALMKKRTNDEYVKTLSEVLNEAEQLKELITILLNIASKDNFENSASLEEIRVDDWIFESKIEILKTNPDAEINLNFELPDSEKSLIIFGNKKMLNLVIINLLLNSIKFSDNKPIHINLYVNGNFIFVDVIDKGIGIPKSEIEQITETFYRASNARNYRGTGLGLTLVNKILKIHNGYLIIDSQENIGTKITIKLPIIS